MNRAGTTPVGLAAASLLTVLVAAVPLLTLDPSAHEGASVLVGVGGVPMVATAIAIEVVRLRGVAWEHVGAGRWWVLAVMPVGVAACTVPAISHNREYFAVDSVGGVVGVAVVMLGLVYLSGGLGLVLWFFTLFPVVELARGLGAVARGDRRGGGHLGAPMMLLPLTAIIVVGTLSLDDLLPGKMATGQVVAALLGIPGSYTVRSPGWLWVLRLLVLAVVAGWTGYAVVRRRHGRSRPASSRS